MKIVNELHLFAGAGGGILGGHLLGHRCVGAVEIDEYCQEVLLERQQEGAIERFPIFGDIRTVDASDFDVDIVAGGFPCQPWSVAGLRKGRNDERHLWPQFARIVAQCRPQYVFAENVAEAAFREPFGDLRGMGYEFAPLLRLGAVDVGAPHRRYRYWMLAYRDRKRREREQARYRAWLDLEIQSRHDAARRRADVGQPSSTRPPIGEGPPAQRPHTATAGAGWWDSEPPVGRVVDGYSGRVDRLRALGNAQVPACAATAFAILMIS